MARKLADLSLMVQYPDGRADAPTRSDVRRWVRASCTLPAQIVVRFVGTGEAQSLNRDYRQKDYPTNVLSFPYESGDKVAGDLVLCNAVVKREAAEQKKPTATHYAHLIVHGMLHLQGYDHETGTEDAERMEAMERQILANLGYPDPYL